MANPAAPISNPIAPHAIRWQRWILPLILVVALIAIPFLPIGTNDVLTLLITTFIAAALASSWNILAGFAGQINLGHAAFFGIGSLVTRQLWLGNIPFLLSFAAGGLAAAGVALITGLPVLRLKGIYFAIGTLALAEALSLTVADALPRASHFPGPVLRSYELPSRYFLAFGVLLVCVGVTWWLGRSRLGLGMIAVREDEAAARSIGINVLFHRMAAFVLSATLAGFAGAAFAYYFASYYPNYPFGAEWTFDALLITFVGGIGSLAGPLIGAVFFVFIQNILTVNLVGLSDLHLVIFGVVFIFVVLALPGGLVEIATLIRRGRARRST